MNFKGTLQTFCESAATDPSEAAANITWEGWEENPASLMHTLAIEKRYDRPSGKYSLILVDGQPIAGGGCYTSDWSPEALVAGVRTWTHPQHRNFWWHGHVLIPRQIEFGSQVGKKAIFLTFNSSSSKLLVFLKRIANGKAVVFGTENPAIYRDFHFLEDEFLIKNRPQKVAFKPLNCEMTYLRNQLLPPRVAP